VDLTIDRHLPEILAMVRGRRAAVIVAPPGAGKTTRIPPALAADGPVIVLQPRRLAARALARRIASENGWTLGEEAGWQVRFERRASARTRVLVATEGILTARLQGDPLLSGFTTIVIDEFHERSIHGDLALALARQAWRARDDLRLVVMSATLDEGPLAAFLEGAPVLRVEGRAHPLSVDYAPETTPAEAIASLWAAERGHLLVFLPGAPEIRRLSEELRRRPHLAGATVLPLHGSLDADAQDAAIAPSAGRKIVLATNLAETSLTVPGVTAVVDTGLHKVLRLDPAVGLDRLETERISRDAADQRAGRAGRETAGRVLRLWDRRDALRDHREPEIARIDLTSPVLDVLAWGGDPRTFEWFEAPPPDRVAAAIETLARLGAVAGGRITPLGRLLRRLPVPPRLARVLVAAGGSPLAAAACAVLTERFHPRGPLPAASSDLLALADRLDEAPPSVRRAAEEIASAARRAIEDGGGVSAVEGDEELLRKALLAGFPDRLARRRAPGSPRLILASGHGAVLDRESAVHDGEFLLALELVAGARGPGSEARVRLASRVERTWLGASTRRVVHRYDPEGSEVRAVEIESIEGLPVSERPVPPDPAIAAGLLAEELVLRGFDPSSSAAANRLRFAGLAVDLRAAAEAAAAGRTALPEIDLLGHLSAGDRRKLDTAAPALLPLPSGRSARLQYREDGTVVAAVKLQELFGLGETPRLGPRGEPVIFELLAPSGRPVQTTSDLRGFWERTYPEVRKELRGRYPRHPWPEDPWSAIPTHRTKRR
jgi:ATP-dependent helicase HrpB